MFRQGLHSQVMFSKINVILVIFRSVPKGIASMMGVTETFTIPPFMCKHSGESGEKKRNIAQHSYVGVSEKSMMGK